MDSELKLKETCNPNADKDYLFERINRKNKIIEILEHEVESLKRNYDLYDKNVKRFKSEIESLKKENYNLRYYIDEQVIFRVNRYDVVEYFTHIYGVKDTVDVFINSGDLIKIHNAATDEGGFASGIVIEKKDSTLEILSTKLYDFTELKQYIMSKNNLQKEQE